MSIYRILLIFVTGLLLFSCSDSGNSDSSPTGTSPQFYDVTVSKSPSDGGTISPTADSSYEEGSQVSLQANPTDAYTFSGWTGTVDTSANPFNITVDKDYNLTANFQIKSYELTVNTTGEGSVTEQIVQQKTDYEHGTIVELTANPAEGWKFIEWQGDLTGSTNPAQITVDDPKSVTAIFEKKSYALTINTSGEGAVSEEIVQAKATDYEFGTTVELTATPSKGWKFVEWQGDLTGSSNPEQIVVDTAKTVTAVFEKKSFAINVSTNGEGSVSKSPDQTEYEYNSTVDLTANPAKGWKFVEWQDDTTSLTNPLNLTVDTTKNYTAVFERKSFTLTINSSGKGSVTKNPDQTEYLYGTLVDLTANPDTGWEFETWDGDTTSSDNPLSISTDSAITVTAVFTNPTFAGGNGTQEYPYQISTVEQLQSINDYTGSHFIQINDIDASATSTWDGGAGFNPIGDDIVRFSGSYDGNGLTVYSLSINRSSSNSIGLFGYNVGTIKNVNLNSVNINGDSGVGALVGNNSGTILSSNISGSVVGNGSTTGGLVGENSGYIYETEANIDVKCVLSCGGLVGWNADGAVIENSSTSGIVEGESGIGGLVGDNRSYSEVKKSYSNAMASYSGQNILLNAGSIGGLIGNNMNNSKVISSQADGDVIGVDKVGGLVGWNFRGSSIEFSLSKGNVVGEISTGGLVGYNEESSIVSSYSLSSTSGDSSIGGLVGLSDSSSNINKSYASGSTSGIIDVGGIIGVNGGSIVSSYWDTENSTQNSGVGRGNSDGTTGLTTSEMTGSSSETNMSALDFVNIWVTTSSYPALFWE